MRYMPHYAAIMPYINHISAQTALYVCSDAMVTRSAAMRVTVQRFTIRQRHERGAVPASMFCACRVIKHTRFDEARRCLATMPRYC